MGINSSKRMMSRSDESEQTSSRKIDSTIKEKFLELDEVCKNMPKTQVELSSSLGKIHSVLSSVSKANRQNFGPSVKGFLKSTNDLIKLLQAENPDNNKINTLFNEWCKLASKASDNYVKFHKKDTNNFKIRILNLTKQFTENVLHSGEYKSIFTSSSGEDKCNSGDSQNYSEEKLYSSASSRTRLFVEEYVSQIKNILRSLDKYSQKTFHEFRNVVLQLTGHFESILRILETQILPAFNGGNADSSTLKQCASNIKKIAVAIIKIIYEYRLTHQGRRFKDKNDFLNSVQNFCSSIQQEISAKNLMRGNAEE